MATQLNPLFHASLSLGDLGIVESVSNCLAPKLDELKGKKIVFSCDDKKMIPVDGWGLRSNSYSAATTVTTIRPIKENALVAAIDSSSVKLAETEEGSLYAIKCGIATAYAGRALMHFKIGPVLFYLSESTIRDSDLEDRLAKLVLLDDDFAKRLIRVRAERAVQKELASHFTNSIILVDGSLKASVFEDRERSLGKIAESCVLRKNMMIGISKGTRLKVLERAAAPLTKVPGPAYIEVDMIIKGLIRNTVGSNSMVKLEKNSPILRADIVGNRTEALGMLLGNDPVAGGYPETLRLAHYISTFTSTDMTCLRSHVLNSYDVTELAADDIRSMLLGSISV
ncbi:DNA double-strand break repair nuclease NurA [Candidatus Nitrososphaera gargensis]|nr:DNA double-strand break repair nuclease NurA [Candidatus Nitrososphaera gargensis]